VAYDTELAERIRRILRPHRNVSERKMFGGIAFMVGGNMACGVIHDELMVRVGSEAFESALAEPHARVMDFTHRPSKGMVYVGVDGIASDEDLARWVGRGTSYAGSLPAK
jgi:TfoX/Sxy family transcriptional regulator of competence genes